MEEQRIDISKYLKFLSKEGWSDLIDERWKEDVKKELLSKYAFWKEDVEVKERNDNEENGYFCIDSDAIHFLFGAGGSCADGFCTGGKVPYRNWAGYEPARF